MKRDFKIEKDMYEEKGNKETHAPAFSRHMDAETGCRKVYAEKVFECQTNSMEA